MIEQQRSYRKPLSSLGIIYLANKEMEICVRNISITGLLAELSSNIHISEIDEIFYAIKASTVIDLYLPEMSLAGEADLVRADKIDGQIYLALDFRSLSYDANDLLYKRRAYRKAISASGDIMFNGKNHRFSTENVSVDGLMIHLLDEIDVKEGTITSFDFFQLGLAGDIKVIWVDKVDDGSTLIGLEYVKMSRDNVQGVPGFLAGR